MSLSADITIEILRCLPYGWPHVLDVGMTSYYSRAVMSKYHQSAIYKAYEHYMTVICHPEHIYPFSSNRNFGYEFEYIRWFLQVRGKMSIFKLSGGTYLTVFGKKSVSRTCELMAFQRINAPGKVIREIAHLKTETLMFSDVDVNLRKFQIFRNTPNIICDAKNTKQSDLRICAALQRIKNCETLEITSLTMPADVINHILRRNKKLQSLKISSCIIVGNIIFPKNNLSRLDIRQCNITDIDYSIVNLRFLRSLDLSANKIASFPKVVVGMKLDVLSLISNDICVLPALNSLTCIKKLNIWNNPSNYNLTALLEELWPLSITIDISYNFPSHIDADEIQELIRRKLSGSNSAIVLHAMVGGMFKLIHI